MVFIAYIEFAPWDEPKSAIIIGKDEGTIYNTPIACSINEIEDWIAANCSNEFELCCNRTTHSFLLYSKNMILIYITRAHIYEIRSQNGMKEEQYERIRERKV